MCHVMGMHIYIIFILLQEIMDVKTIKSQFKEFHYAGTSLKLCWHTAMEVSFVSLLNCNQLGW